MMKKWLCLLIYFFFFATTVSLSSCKDKEVICRVSNREIPTFDLSFRLFYDDDDQLVRIDEFERLFISNQNRLMYNNQGQLIMEERLSFSRFSDPVLEFRGELTYDAAGRLATANFYFEDSAGALVLQQTADFSYANGQLSSIEYERPNNFQRTTVEILESIDGNITKVRAKSFSTLSNPNVATDEQEMRFDYDSFEQLRHTQFFTLALPHENHWPFHSKNNVVLTQITRFDQDGEVISLQSIRRDLSYDGENRVVRSRINTVEETFEYECVER
ncbi:MAG: hypothetical protein AAGG75_11000 [Bacteroidota bacterium]